MKKLYFLLLAVFVGFVGNAQFNYPDFANCTMSPSAVPVFAPGTSMGGTFTSSPGLWLNAVTGEINPGASAPGTYAVTYSVPAGPPDFIAYNFTAIVQIIAPMVPTFNAIPTFCYGSTPPTMPNVSTDGFSGIWTVAETSIDNSTIVTYTFTPNFGQCAQIATMTAMVIQPVTGFITTENGSNTVYVDENDIVVAPLTLANAITSNEYTYRWYENSSLIFNATAANYTVNTASTNEADRTFTVEMTNVLTGCSSMSNEFVVHQSSGVAPPAGLVSQTLPSGATLGDLVVSGTGIQWYASLNDKNALAAALPLSTLLVDNTTYYASQTVNGSESVERLPVTVHLVLGIGENELTSVSYFPNPVKNSLTIKALNAIDGISIINLLGQVLKTTKHNQAEVIESMSEFTAGTYFIRVSSGSKTGVFKIVKQ